MFPNGFGGADPMGSVPGLRCVIHAVPGGVRVTVAGEVDLLTQPRLAAMLTAAGNQVRTGQELVIDLAEVSLLGAAGLAVLAELADVCAERRIRLRLRSAGPLLVRVLEVAALDGYLDLGTSPPVAGTAG
ncbi:STAS domain-containing protein [Nocardia yamanashiensis]|uniref:STAS domain-containing protein n=1 Tax=Nocardia yamanashiensis TaxID=209247 RepID=UPI001E3909BD|nr:STAS domain-containing protein [Nocardia yamanashiensis]UGT44272.1 STAS domain-containing protein [Nocardia yamanashiensis]